MNDLFNGAPEDGEPVKITTISVGVKFLSFDETTLAEAECHIALPASGKVPIGQLIDACQRSVAHCIDTLEKHLDK